MLDRHNYEYIAHRKRLYMPHNVHVEFFFQLLMYTFATFTVFLQFYDFLSDFTVEVATGEEVKKEPSLSPKK